MVRGKGFGLFATQANVPVSLTQFIKLFLSEFPFRAFPTGFLLAVSVLVIFGICFPMITKPRCYLLKVGLTPFVLSLFETPLPFFFGEFRGFGNPPVRRLDSVLGGSFISRPSVHSFPTR